MMMDAEASKRSLSLLELETPSTFLRRFEPRDAEPFFQFNLDPEVVRYTGDKPFESVEEARQFLAQYGPNQYERFGVGRLAVVSKADGQFMGWCGLKYHPDPNEYDIGYRFFAKYWGKGLASETSWACLDAGFRHLSMEDVVGRSMPANKASVRVLEKLGMAYRGEQELYGYRWSVYFIRKATWLTGGPSWG